MRSIFSKYPPTPKEIQLKFIISNLLQHPKTKLLMDPLREHYYIDNKELNYFVLITDSTIKITNHKFYYTNDISGRFSTSIQNIMKSAISEDRQRIEDEMFKNEAELLLEISKKVSPKGMPLA
jgi:hypothetical protein